MYNSIIRVAPELLILKVELQTRFPNQPSLSMLQNTIMNSIAVAIRSTETEVRLPRLVFFSSSIRRRFLSRVAPPSPTEAKPIRYTSKNVAYLGKPKEGPKPRQLLQLPPFSLCLASSSKPLPGRKKPPGSPPGKPPRVTAITWLKHYFADVLPSVIQDHFNRGLVRMECSKSDQPSSPNQPKIPSMKQVNHDEPMRVGMRLYVSVSIAESKVSRRYDTIPSATLHPNADEINYLRRLVCYSDSALIVINKPPKLPVKGNLPVHNSMDALAAAAFSYGSEESPKLVHRLDKESSGLVLMGRTKDSFTRLHWLFTNINLAKSSCTIWNEACEATLQRYWALVIGTPSKKEGVISAPLSKVFLNDGKTERVVLAHPSGIDGCQDALTEYRVMGPTINGCSWVELRPITGRKHQLRVHCAEALGTPIVGDYKYGWCVHKKWMQMPRVDYEPSTGEPYRLRRPERLPVQKGSVLSKVPLLHLHCREMVIPNIAKFFSNSNNASKHHDHQDKPNLLHLVAPMPSHMKISWNLMSSYLI
ncbi:RNA pseudouridine synthase 3, mitochondrial [Zostera marina]|uniref:RNA pseudouridine synthase 3, mitochondrial n=1 Tax=Zostera marina TaxID=29655 RepID=A0A0K9PZP3_ZOSMR|nr:RNA pseudouridine synthase 3, mitochondrial [Zostera marina]